MIVPRDRRRFRELRDPNDRDAAAKDLEAWGYPRPLVEGELELSFWFRYGLDAVIFWLNQTEAMEPLCHWFFHICARPELRSSLNGRRIFTAVGRHRAHCASPNSPG
jgi:hypothetical protein